MPPPPARTGVVLALVVTCQLMIVLDASVVNIALASIQEDLGFSATGLSWVVNAYLLAFGGLLLLGGRLGDLFGRRRVFTAGVALFTLASLAGGVAPSDAALVVARAVQGVGAALAAPSGLAILLATFAQGAPRNRALGLFAAMAGAGGSIGLLLGGVLTEWVSWRWVLLINVPVGLVMLALIPRHVAGSGRGSGRFDLAGALSGTLGTATLVYGFIRVGSGGWGDGQAGVAFALALLVLGGFVAVERRAEQPLLPFRLFARREAASAYVTILLVPAVMLGTFFFLAQFLQVVLAFSAVETGLAFLPLGALVFAGSQAVPRGLPRFGPRPFMIVGAVLLLAGAVWLTQITVKSGYVTAVAGPLALLGLGAGLLYMPLSAVLIAGVRAEDLGAASGAMQTAQHLGAALGVAVRVAAFGGAAGRAAEMAPADFAAGAADAFVVGVGLAGLVLFLVLFAVRPSPAARSTPSRPRTEVAA